MFETVKKFFDEDGWSYNQIEGEPALITGINAKNGKWKCIARVREQQVQFVFYSICPVNVPEKSRPAMAEFVTRANYGLIIGNFEMDFNDGEIRYKTSIDVENSELTPALIKNLVYPNVLEMDRYLPGIMAVTFAGASPSLAIKDIESPDETSGN
jgi:hypothetical protein